ncbi:MAG: NIPSNAP family protein [Actinomycetota bacterium]|nr:NIPSNAP family protein [Actinomycetota bacterium]
MTDAPIVEVRTYHIKPGYRHEFVELFQERARPAQELYGMKVLGPLLDLENPNVVIWLRSFPSLEDRDRLKNSLYEGPEWTSGLEELVMPMLDRCSLVVTQASPEALEGSLIHER